MRVLFLPGTCLAVFVLGADLMTRPAPAADQPQPPLPVTPTTIYQPPPAAPLPAQPAIPTEQPPSRFAAGIGLGTLGLGAEFSAKVTESMVARFDAGGYAFSVNHDIEGNTFSLQPEMIRAALLFDWHLLANGFRLSAGPTFQDFRAAGSALVASGSTIVINGDSYTAAEVGTLRANFTDNKAGGYFGIGYDAIHFSAERFGVSFDFGAIYVGSPKVTLTATGSAPGLAGDLQAEQENADRSLRFFCVYPVVMITAKYGL